MKENDVYSISEYTICIIYSNSLQCTFSDDDDPRCTWKITHSFSCEIFKRRNPHPFVSVNLSIRVGGSL